MDWTEIIAAIATILTVIIKSGSTNNRVDKTNNRVEELHAASEQSQLRSEILLLCIEDRTLVNEGKLPTNYKDIMGLFDRYKEIGGNRYMERKIDEYEQWYLGLTEKKGAK